MELPNLKRIVANTYSDIVSTKIDRPILVIESDDWGSIRTKDKHTREQLNKLSLEISDNKYCQKDGIADANDLNQLFETLARIKDKNNNPACVTINTCTANPDFEKIKKDKFRRFHFETFKNTIIKSKEGSAVWKLWEEGIKKEMFVPQLHGREHLHAMAWLSELREGNKELLSAFDLETWGIPFHSKVINRKNTIQAALDIYGFNGEYEFQRKWILDSAHIFEQIFGFSSKTFIAPSYTWHDRIIKYLKNVGIEALQGIKLQYHPTKKGYRKKFHYTGQRRNNLTYLVRNVFFEPALLPEKNWIDETFNGIEQAFNRSQPAIIGSHRINFIGRLDEKNRILNLSMLKKILRKVVRKYPEIEFMSSDKLLNELEK